MRVIFFGTPKFALASLTKLLQQENIEVIAVITQPDKRRGRGNQMIPSPIKKLAIEHKIPTLEPVKIKKDQNTIKYLQEAKADVFIVVAYGQILSSEILKIPKLGCINLHGSILPKYRGAAPIQWSIYNGETETGNTTILMDAGMDTGAMLLKSNTPIDLWDNVEELSDKLANQGGDLLIETLEKLAKKEIIPIPQDNNLATYARLINKFDYEINWSNSALQIHNQVRAFYPNCVTFFRDKSLKIMRTLPIAKAKESVLPIHLSKLESYYPEFDHIHGEIGEIVKIIKNIGFLVQTGNDLLLILEVQLAGKKAQSAWDFINGSRVKIGEKIINETGLITN